MKKLRDLVRNSIRKTGYDLTRFPPLPESTARRRLFFQSQEFDILIDIGANSGQFASYAREHLRFGNRIISFEPLKAAFGELKAKADADPKWEAHNFAIGDEPGKKEINIAGNSFSSSLLEMLPAHLSAAPHSKYESKEWVEVRTLDSFLGSLFGAGERIYLKIDAQGFEKKILAGAAKSLDAISTIQLEISLVPLYQGEPTFGEMYPFLTGFGFSLIDIDAGFTDPKSGRLLQMDGVFQKTAS